MLRILREDINNIKEMPLECIKGATLLSKEEAENLLTQEERKCKGTQKAENNRLYVAPNGNSWYWLRSVGNSNYYAYGVYYDGDILDYYDVNSTFVGIRPALILNLQSSNLGVGDTFEFGDYAFKVISNNLALCDVIIGACPFNKNKEDGNDYEKSDAKKYVDKWFEKTMEYEKEQEENKRLGYKTDDEIFNDDFDF